MGLVRHAVIDSQIQNGHGFIQKEHGFRHPVIDSQIQKEHGFSHTIIDSQIQK